MKRLFTIRIGDKDYPITYTLRVFKNLSDKYGSPDKAIEKMNGEAALPAMEAQIFALHQMILAGAKVAQESGQECPKPLTLEETKVYSSLTHISQIKNIVINGITLCSKPSIEAAPAKKKARIGKPTVESYLWQGLHMGLSYGETMDIPFGELLSLIGEDSIQHGAKERIRNTDDDVIPDWE